MAKGRRFVVTEMVEPVAPLSEALERLVTLAQGFDKVTRFRLAASDMNLAVNAAAALVDADEGHGWSARVHQRIIETGMVVTYARPFVESNEAGLGRKWWPRDTEMDRELHDELVDLRNEYHTHARHTPRRRLENAASLLGDKGRPRWAESWERLPVWKLRPLADLAGRQARRFDAEAERLDAELFGPVD